LFIPIEHHVREKGRPSGFVEVHMLVRIVVIGGSHATRSRRRFSRLLNIRFSPSPMRSRVGEAIRVNVLHLLADAYHQSLQS